MSELRSLPRCRKDEEIQFIGSFGEHHNEALVIRSNRRVLYFRGTHD